MAMKRCPVCGERYSDTYRECPFCEEEDAIREGEEIRRIPYQGGRRTAAARQPSLITPILIVMIFIMASLLVYLLWGDKIGDKLGGKDDQPIGGGIQQTEPTPGETSGTPAGTGTDPAGAGGAPSGTGDGSSGSTPSGGTSTGTPSGGNGTMPGGSGDTPQVGTPSGGGTEALTYASAAALPGGLTLNKTDFTQAVDKGAVQLRASGGNGTYTWISEDPGIASVDASGLVTPISAGTTNVVVTDGSKKSICIVRIKAGSGTTTTTAPVVNPGDSGSGGTHSLNKTDFTRSVSEGSYQLKVSGVTTAITWSSSNSAVATVDANGNVTPIAKGKATITASWDGQSLSCIVRVPG